MFVQYFKCIQNFTISRDVTKCCINSTCNASRLCTGRLCTGRSRHMVGKEILLLYFSYHLTVSYCFFQFAFTYTVPYCKYSRKIFKRLFKLLFISLCMLQKIEMKCGSKKACHPEPHSYTNFRAGKHGYKMLCYKTFLFC
jgi:hypothetical protein